MSEKAKLQKHTAKEIAMKDHEAKMRQGGRGGGAKLLKKERKTFLLLVIFVLIYNIILKTFFKYSKNFLLRNSIIKSN